MLSLDKNDFQMFQLSASHTMLKFLFLNYVWNFVFFHEIIVTQN